MSVIDNLNSIQQTIPQGVTLVAVSKTYPPDIILEVCNAGQRIFGENRPQELVQKHEQLPDDIKWHFIGHLQTNKVKYIVPFVTLIHSVDSLRLFKEINKEATKVNRKIDCLLQVHIAEEESKFGFSEEELIAFLQLDEVKSALNIRICGLMGMATFTDDTEQVRCEFKSLKTLFDKIKSTFFISNLEFKELSMGMSGDYLTAIEEGATIVRVGSSIFGERAAISKN